MSTIKPSVTLRGMTRKTGDRTYEAFGENVATVETNHSLQSFNLRRIRRRRLCVFRGDATLNSF